MSRLRTLLRSVRRAARAVADKFPLTLLGLLVAGGAGGAVFYFGRQRQDLVLYVVGLGAGGLAAVVLVLVTVTTLLLRLGWRGKTREPTRVEAGKPIVTGFSLPALGWLPLVSLRWEWNEPERVELKTHIARGRIVEEVTFRERGEQTRTVRRVIVEDVFGLARLALRLVEITPRVVLPARGRPLVAPLLDALAGGDAVSHPLGPPDGDLIEMRRYAPGDPMKRVLWKTYARTRTLMVRLPEKAISPTRRTLAYLVTGDGDEAPAGIARMAIETLAFGPDWRFGSDGAPTPARVVDDAVTQIVRSRVAGRPVQGQGLGKFIDESADFGSYRCVIFAPAHLGPWLAPIEHEVKRRAGRVEVILGADGIRDEAAKKKWRRVLLKPGEDELSPDVAHAREVELITRRLAAAGATVTVVDRPSGKGVVRGGRSRRAA